MPVVDEYSQECLALETERSISAEDIVGTLARFVAVRSAPEYIRSANAPRL